MHDHDDSKCGNGTLSGAVDVQRVNLSDLTGLCLPNYALWDFITSTGISNIRRIHSRLESEYETDSKLAPTDLARRYLSHKLSQLEICRVILRSSTLAISDGVKIPPMPMIGADHLLPLPSPWAHIVICGNARDDSFAIFDTDTMRFVGKYDAEPRAEVDVRSAAMMWFDFRNSTDPAYIFVTSFQNRHEFFEIKLQSAVDGLSFSFQRIAVLGCDRDALTVTAVCCTRSIDEFRARLISAWDDGALCGYETAQTKNFAVHRTLGPITHRRHGERSKRKPVMRTMCALPEGRVATAGGDGDGADGLIRIWHLNEPISSEGVAVTSELRVPEHAGRRIVDLQIAAIQI